MDPGIAALDGAHLNELVDGAASEFGVAHHLGEFLVEEFVTGAPIDTLVGERKVEGEELGEQPGEGLLPGAVGRIGRCGHGWAAGRGKWPTGSMLLSWREHRQ